MGAGIAQDFMRPDDSENDLARVNLISSRFHRVLTTVGQH